MLRDKDVARGGGVRTYPLEPLLPPPEPPREPPLEPVIPVLAIRKLCPLGKKTRLARAIKVCRLPPPLLPPELPPPPRPPPPPPPFRFHSSSSVSDRAAISGASDRGCCCGLASNATAGSDAGFGAATAPPIRLGASVATATTKPLIFIPTGRLIGIKMRRR